MCKEYVCICWRVIVNFNNSNLWVCHSHSLFQLFSSLFLSSILSSFLSSSLSNHLSHTHTPCHSVLHQVRRLSGSRCQRDWRGGDKPWMLPLSLLSSFHASVLETDERSGLHAFHPEYNFGVLLTSPKRLKKAGTVIWCEFRSVCWWCMLVCHPGNYLQYQTCKANVH